MRVFKLIISIILLFSLFSYQSFVEKFTIDYDYTIPAKTEQQLEEKIRKMKDIVSEKQLQEKIAASYITNNKPTIIQKKMICEGK